MTPSRPCTPPGATRNPLMTSSKISSAPLSSAPARSSSRKPSDGSDEAHVGRVGLGEDRGELVEGERLGERGGIVPRHDDRARGDLGRHAGRGGDALRRQTAAGVGEQAVDVAVVRAGELQELRAAGDGAGEADRAHRSLGAGRRHAQHLHARHAPADLVGEVDLGDRRRAERRPALRGVDDRRDDLRVRVAMDEGPPRADPVDVAVVVDVDELGALRAVDEDRVAPDRVHRAHGRVHAARQVGERPRVVLGGARVGEGGGHRSAGRLQTAPCSRSQLVKSSVKYRRRIFLNSVEE